MKAIEIIEKKRDKKHLSKKEINFFLNAYLDGFIADYQMSALLMAIYINDMDEEETSYLTDAMLHSGITIEHQKQENPLIDKHSTGGVGDKVSIALAPLAAACGLLVPMISGRGLGHTGGTLDKLESIPGFRTNLSIDELKSQLNEVGVVIMGQTQELAPADKRIYALRDVTGTVASIPLIAASIMSKKLASGIDGLVLDIKYGSGAFMKNTAKAQSLATLMVAIGARLGKKVTALITNMDQHLGTMIGNALEIKESIDILHGRGPSDSTSLTIELCAEMLMLAKKCETLIKGRDLAKTALQNGRAFDVFVAMVTAQGGNRDYVLTPELFKEANRKITILASNDGYIKSLDCQALGMAVNLLGGGRFKLDDKINPAVGIELKIKIGDRVFKDQPIGVIHADDIGFDEALIRIDNAISIDKEKVEANSLYYKRISTN